ncbi:hypothetical protein SEA_MISCHIEF19_55 [Streptomyces phage Mischief19]|nr:hypothetical protein SEA_MISCHIEF19_55 [Streptomyces phage Mischief19]
MADNPQMIVEVNERLRDEIIAASRVIESLEREAVGCRNGVLNDRQHYDTVANALELLTISTLSATSSVSLLGRKGILGHMRARFDMGAGSQVARHVNASVAYLRTDASALLAVNSFSQYEGENVDKAFGMLKTLLNLLLNSISAQATADLRSLKRLDAGLLLMAADELADHAATDTRPSFDPREASISNPSPKGLPVPPTGDSWNPAG